MPIDITVPPAFDLRAHPSSGYEMSDADVLAPRATLHWLEVSAQPERAELHRSERAADHSQALEIEPSNPRASAAARWLGAAP